MGNKGTFWINRLGECRGIVRTKQNVPFSPMQEMMAISDENVAFIGLESPVGDP